MKSKSLPKGFPASREDWEKLVAEAPGEDGQPTPEEEARWANAVVAHSYDELKAKLAARRRRGPGKAPRKTPTTIRFDPDVLDGLKALGRGWQTRVNEVMRKYLETRA